MHERNGGVVHPPVTMATLRDMVPIVCCDGGLRYDSQHKVVSTFSFLLSQRGFIEGKDEHILNRIHVRQDWVVLRRECNNREPFSTIPVRRKSIAAVTLKTKDIEKVLMRLNSNLIRFH